YDTLRQTISGGPASLEAMGITYRETNVIGSSKPWESAVAALSPRTRAVFVQKSKGYSDRPALSSEVVGRIAREVRSASPGCVTIVDNCYGEFVEVSEPTAEGADLIAGSLIKNPGGGLAPAGGYIAGRSDLVDAAAERLTAPGIGGGVGASLGVNRAFFQGLFLAPHVVAQALKGAVFFSRLFENLGFMVDPDPGQQRYDLVQAVDLGSARRLKGFCAAVQAWSPVDSHVTPEPWRMPGYDHDVIMAAGTFVQGSSIELSADAPFEAPYRVFVQGGLCLEHAILAAVHAADTVLKM
ncbi:MAG: methionine gamma-lyase family protein, partial [Bacillota bacterium]